jgi:hypothetical protein
MSRVLQAALVFAAIALTPSAALPCSSFCMGGTMTPAEAFRRSQIVLIGTALQVETGKTASVRVDELYKGTVPATVDVDSGWNTDCRMWLESGKQYLLFFWPPEKGVLKLVPEYTCSPSGEVGESYTAEAVSWVRRRKPRAVSGGAAGSTGECLRLNYSEDGKPKRAPVAVTLIMGEERVPATGCEGGFIVPPAVAGYVGPIQVEMAVRGRTPTFELRAGYFDDMSSWDVDVDRPPFRVRTAEEVAAYERGGRHLKLIYTLVPQARGGDPMMHMLFLFED